MLRYWYWEKRWNEKHKDKPYAQLTPPPFKQRVKRMVHWYLFDFRTWVATSIAPWLKEE